MFYKIVNGLVAVEAKDYLTHESTSACSRNNFKYRQIQRSTPVFQNSFFPRIIPQWNTVQHHVVAWVNLLIVCAFRGQPCDLCNNIMPHTTCAKHQRLLCHSRKKCYTPNSTPACLYPNGFYAVLIQIQADNYSHCRLKIANLRFFFEGWACLYPKGVLCHINTDTDR